ncbi:hypothetical protein K1X76_03845 [bacterium]|nr:hypothetical protein [bacterium]
MKKINQNGMTIKELIIVIGLIVAMVGVSIPLFHYLKSISPNTSTSLPQHSPNM